MAPDDVRSGSSRRGRGGDWRSGHADGVGGGVAGRSGHRRGSRGIASVQPEAPARPRERQTRTSRAAANDTLTRSALSRSGPGRQRGRLSSRSRDLSPGSWEEEEDDDDDDDEEDEEAEAEDEDEEEDGEEDEEDEEEDEEGGNEGVHEAARAGVDHHAHGLGDLDDASAALAHVHGVSGHNSAVVPDPRAYEGAGVGVGVGVVGVGSVSAGDAGVGGAAAAAADPVVQNPADTWHCRICTFINEVTRVKCSICNTLRSGTRRQQSAAPAAPIVSGREDPGNSHGAADGSRVAGARRGRGSQSKARGSSSGSGGSRRTASTAPAAPEWGIASGPSRQTRTKARVNYAEGDDDDDEDVLNGMASVAGVGRSSGGAGAVGRGRGGTSRPRGGGSRAKGGGGKALKTYSLREELSRAGRNEEGLSDEVRGFRRGVRELIRKMKPEAYAVHFLDPVDVEEYPDYPNFVSTPMDLATILGKLRLGIYDSLPVSHRRWISSMSSLC